MTGPDRFVDFVRRFGAAALGIILLTPATSLAAPAVGETKLIMLGTGGGPVIRSDRAEPSTLLVVDGVTYLIDCGTGSLRRLVEAGFQPQDVRAIFITHHHPDHDLDLANIMASDFFSIGGSENKTIWNIYGPPRTAAFVDAAAKYIGVAFNTFAAEGLTGGEEDIPPHFAAHDIAHSGLVYKDDKISVTATENAHFALMDAKYNEQIKSFSYRIQTPHGVVVFTGDTGPSDNVRKLAKGADVLVSEVIDLDLVLGPGGSTSTDQWSDERKAALRRHLESEHLVPAAVAKIAKKARVRSVVLYHFVPGTGEKEAIANAAAVKAGYSGPVIASRDLAHYCVNARKGEVLPLCD